MIYHIRISQSDFDTFLGLVLNTARDSHQCFTNRSLCDEAVPWPPKYIQSMDKLESTMHSLHSHPNSYTRPFFDFARNVQKQSVWIESVVGSDGTVGSSKLQRSEQQEFASSSESHVQTVGLAGTSTHLAGGDAVVSPDGAVKTEQRKPLVRSQVKFISF
jgi:hypothetical protein